ncbi:MAG: hypothetical protein MR787_03625 [Bacteroidales bacterium]|nr:hypothetical protein [Bacteroidales bacterium]
MMKRLWQWSVLLVAMQIVGAVQLLAQEYAVSWFVSGEEQVVFVSAGEEIVPPFTPECDSLAFVGWSAASTVAEDGSDFVPVADFGAAQADTAFYAVFAQETLIPRATYSAGLITSESELEDGGLYMIEQQGAVARNLSDNKKLYTTANYKTAELTGTEEYLWRFVASVDAKGAVRGYYLQSANSEQYLRHKYADKTDLDLSNYKTTYFRVVYTDTCWNIIGLNDRVLGYSSSTEKSYKAYVKSEINPYFIQLYRVKQDMDMVYSDYSMVCPKADTPSAVDVQPSVSSDKPQKLLDGNQVVILREGMRYNLLGKRLGR